MFSFLWLHYKLQQWSDEESMKTWEDTDLTLNGYDIIYQPDQLMFLNFYQSYCIKLTPGSFKEM